MSSVVQKGLMKQRNGKTVMRDDLMELSEAAELLGLSSFRRINVLIRKGLLKAYKFDFLNRKFVKRTDVEALAVPREVEL